MNIRGVAAQVIYQVAIKKNSLADVLPARQAEFDDLRDKALLQALCYGVIRWYVRLEIILQALLKKDVKPADLDLYCLLLVGIYQLLDMRMSPHAAVSETVSATQMLKKSWARGWVNGVLREFQRQQESFVLDPYSHPNWIVKKLKQAYPHHWETILTENNAHPPFMLRVNQQKISRQQYLEKLIAAGVEAQVIPYTFQGIQLTHAMDVKQLPGFSAGEISVQDGAAQLAADLLELESGQIVLDACAAPGGKTAHILETQPAIDCLAIDHDANRVKIIEENLQRLELPVKCLTADVGDLASWWRGQAFDRILLDAPCSASGVIRRHPDIKLLRRKSDLRKLAETQFRLLTAVWQTLKEEGLLLYVTCSVFPDENVDVLQAFLASHPDAMEEKIQAPWGLECTIGKQILPGMNGMDGFYFARLRKRGTNQCV